jgi:stage IV sporulation protein FB
MGWQDRRYDDRDDGSGIGGSFRRAMRRLFVDGDDFYSWSVPFVRVLGIAVRIHIFYLVIIAARLIFPFQPGARGLAFEAFGMVSLFVLVLLHEFGHCFACRWVGGEADRILMWPLGGLAYARPPHNWKAALITTLGGPGVNVLLIPVLGGVLLAMGAPLGALIYNPFDPQSVFTLNFFTFDTSYARFFAWWAYNMNLILLLFNMLLPMFPMDCGRVVQELLWARIGFRKSMLIATNLGIFTAVLVGVFALTTGQNLLFAVAFFCGFNSFQERTRTRMMEDAGPLEAYDFSRGHKGMPGAEPADDRRTYEKARKQQERENKEREEVDRILAKIATQGMGSLTRSERKTLEAETARKRAGSAGRG